MASKPETVEEGLAATEREIMALEAKLKTLRMDRDAFLLVLDRLQKKAPEKHPELIPPTNGHLARGAIVKAVLDVVRSSPAAISPREVKATLLRRGIKPNGDEKNFGITVAKALRSLAKKEISQHKAGHLVTYTAK